jgi:hypothetical protein
LNSPTPIRDKLCLLSAALIIVAMGFVRTFRDKPKDKEKEGTEE